MTATSYNLPAYSLFAGMLAMAGLPIYIHAPKFYLDNYGVGLAALGGTLFALRLIDVVQDPILGWLAQRLRACRGLSVAIATTLMAAAMIGLFAVPPVFNPLLWFALTLALLFSGFSFLTITFYAQGVSKAGTLGDSGHVRLAGWRESGALLGVSLAAMAPTVLWTLTDQPFAAFALLFALLAAAATWAMRSEWTPAPTPNTSHGFRTMLADPLSRRLLLIALFNAMPVAATATLFLFFVESRLAAAGWEGPLLLLFFIAAALAAPFWARLATQIGTKLALLSGMSLSIAAFAWAAFLGFGDVLPFAIICVASGAALGADMTLLPAMFAKRAAQISPEAAQGFGLWSFASKFSLAFAAAILLPILEASGFQSGADNASEQALLTLTALYAVVPCALKLIAIALLVTTDLGEPVTRTVLKEA